MSTTELDSETYILKTAAAARQLNASIRMLLADEDQLAIHTVASAAYRILRDLRKQRGRDERYDGLVIGFYSVAKLLEDGKIDKIPEDLATPETERIVEFIRKGIQSDPLRTWHDLQLIPNGSEREFWARFSETANYLKHADKDSGRPHDVSRIDKKNEGLLLRASSAYVALMNSDTPEIKALVVYLYGDKPGMVPWLTPEFNETFGKLSREQKRKLCIDRYVHGT